MNCIIDSNILDRLFKHSIKQLTSNTYEVNELFIHPSEEEIKLHNDDPDFFTDASIFNNKNWNSGQDLLRYYLLHQWDIGKVSEDYLYTQNDKHFHFSSHIWTEYDQWYGYIIIKNIYDIYEPHYCYFSTWYKRRGTTENITFNGRPINEYEYIKLCNILVQLGCLDFMEEDIQRIISEKE